MQEFFLPTPQPSFLAFLVRRAQTTHTHTHTKRGKKLFLGNGRRVNHLALVGLFLLGGKREEWEGLRKTWKQIKPLSEHPLIAPFQYWDLLWTLGLEAGKASSGTGLQKWYN